MYIKLNNVSKVFKRFNNPFWAAVNALGLYVPSIKYNTFHALSSINIEIKAGERVALIGRNGAGKSTMLRLISGQMHPDKGQVEVKGKVQALMELGTGFHPDFTGIENIRASLAFYGLAPREIQKKIAEIIEFTELEDFIERPMREYSSGMYSRLAFAVSTSISPEILIIDEILGAGDAYFIGKSIQRMKSLTEEGATVLFVSHDISAAQMLCDRALWIDKGQIIADGPILQVGKSYLAAVRAEEELRVRAQSAKLTKQQLVSCSPNKQNVLFRLIGEDSVPPSNPLKVFSIRYGVADKMLGEITPLSIPQNNTRVILDNVHMNWQVKEKKHTKICWEFGDFGGLFHHAPWVIEWPELNNYENFWVELECIANVKSKILVEQFDEGSSEYFRIGEILPTNEKGNNIQKSLRFKVVTIQRQRKQLDLELLESKKTDSDDHYGSMEVNINGFGFFDKNDERRHTLITGQDSYAVISYITNQPVINPVAVVAVYKPDGSCAMQVISNLYGQNIGTLNGTGYIKFKFTPFLLGEGDYIVSVALFKELNLASRIEPPAYDIHDRCYMLKVLPPEGIAVNLGILNQPYLIEVIK
ncbi:MAG: ABC transporter ATP-binding protein [Rickettsiaceae bacterium]|nr:ABC transporter ATP-binding protein [Rickettsiaceae bacterium]MCP5374525.1 ABC transporter ATP-binding protein [Rickettsiaceae bacterium]MCP5378129.1 ABC transporter ATP-binding protein [Rickettsiaceae bacterium]